MQEKKPNETRTHVEGPGAGNQTAAATPAPNEVHRLLHQLNQPLTAISNYARAGVQLIDNGTSDPARMKELFEKIATQAGRTNTLSQDLAAAVTKLGQGEEQE